MKAKPQKDSRKRKPQLASEQPAPKMGRPKTGKRSNPDFRQITAWVRRDTYLAVQRRLLDTEGEVSELVQALFEEWLAKPAKRGK